MANQVTYVSIENLPSIGYSDSSFNLSASKTIIDAEITQNDGHGNIETKNITKSISLPDLISGLYVTSLADILKVQYGLIRNDTTFADNSTYINKLRNQLKFKHNDYDNTLVFSQIPEIPDGNNSTVYSNAISENTLANKLKNGSNYVSIADTNGFTFKTKYNNLENSTIKEFDSIAEAPSTNDDKHNRYIFKISQHTSTESYICPESGWFMCYGWLAEKEKYTASSVNNNGEGRQDNSKRWAALEAKFGNEWKIIQLQPVTAGNYCNYVSFSVPVRQNLELRVSTGFDVGKNSGQYSNVAGSLTNHIPNAFIGGIYTYA